MHMWVIMPTHTQLDHNMKSQYHDNKVTQPWSLYTWYRVSTFFMDLWHSAAMETMTAPVNSLHNLTEIQLWSLLPISDISLWVKGKSLQNGAYFLSCYVKCCNAVIICMTLLSGRGWISWRLTQFEWIKLCNGLGREWSKGGSPSFGKISLGFLYRAFPLIGAIMVNCDHTLTSSVLKVIPVSQDHLTMTGTQVDPYILTYVLLKAWSIFEEKSALLCFCMT